MPIVRGGYGQDLYGSGDYGTEGVIHDATASLTATSTVNAEGGRSLESGATVSAISSFTSSGVRERESSASISATLTIVVSGEDIIREDSDKFSYGSGLYGLSEYDQADLQTIVSATSSIASVSGVRVQNGSAISSASSSTTSDAEKIHLGLSLFLEATSTTSATAVYTIIGVANTSCSSDITAIPTRIRSSGATISTTSGTFTIGREKWEVVAPTSTSWTEIAA